MSEKYGKFNLSVETSFSCTRIYFIPVINTIGISTYIFAPDMQPHCAIPRDAGTEGEFK